jgi:hypothetical protein
MSDDLFDDGLVHSHGWASTANRPAEHVEQDDEEHDDGLVHGHSWAATPHR